MTTTVLGTLVSFNNGSQQNTGTYVGLDTYTGGVGTGIITAYPVGHYLLIENNSYGSYSIAMPLNGWDSSTYSSPVYIRSITFSTETFLSPASFTQSTTVHYVYSRVNTNLGSNATQISGTWKSRGGNLSGFLVQRVA